MLGCGCVVSKFLVSIDGTRHDTFWCVNEGHRGRQHIIAVTKVLFKNSKDEEETTMWIDDLTINLLALVFTNVLLNLMTLKTNIPRV